MTVNNLKNNSRKTEQLNTFLNAGALIRPRDITILNLLTNISGSIVLFPKLLPYKQLNIRAMPYMQYTYSTEDKPC